MVRRSRAALLTSRRLVAALLAGAAFVAAPAVAGAPPGVELYDALGHTVALSPAAGEGALVLHFFASWCEPCARELPIVAHAAAACANAADGAPRVVAVDVGESAERAREFLRAHAVDLPLLLDPHGATWRRAGLRGLPANLVLRADHEGLAIDGPQSADAWRARLDALGCRPPQP